MCWAVIALAYSIATRDSSAPSKLLAQLLLLVQLRGAGHEMVAKVRQHRGQCDVPIGRLPRLGRVDVAAGLDD